MDWKRVKRIVVTCGRGTEPYLAEEIAALGLKHSAITHTAVTLAGSLMDTLTLNLHLRTAHRVLYELVGEYIRDADELYQWVNQLPWESVMQPDGHLTITTTVEDNPTIRDPRFAALRCKDAIVDRFQEKFGQRPDSGSERKGIVLHLRWIGDEVQLFLDTSGEPLSHRGYRKHQLEAPMRETLAAACLLASKWDGQVPLLNPMCGSGTLAIEAVLIATKKAPGLLREAFAFQHIVNFPRDHWAAMRDEAAARVITPAAPIMASDIREEALSASKANARHAGVLPFIDWEVCDFKEVKMPSVPGLLIMNPEYGERMGSETDLLPVYKSIGDFLKQRCKGWRAYVFTCNLPLSKLIGLRTMRRIPLFNGPLEGRLLEFECYAGTRHPRNDQDRGLAEEPPID